MMMMIIIIIIIIIINKDVLELPTVKIRQVLFYRYLLELIGF